MQQGVRLALASVDMAVALSTGEAWRHRPRRAAVIRLFDYAFFGKIIMRHDTGMGESYMDGDYEVTTPLYCAQVPSTSIR
jgi:hypothetical protein